jgi:fibronectin type 3 domain-containing protein
VQTYDYATPADDTPPTRPTGLSCGINAAHDVELDWNAATDDTQVRGYTIYRDDALLATVPATQLDYIDTEAAPETTYRYSVDAFDAQGNHSRPSAAVTCITPAFDTTAPSTPTDIRATLVGWSHVDLTWAAATDDTGVAGYIIRRNGVVLAIVDGATTYLSDETVQPGMTYRYTVNAFDRFGNDSQSSVAVIVKTPIVVLLPLIRGGEP